MHRWNAALLAALLSAGVLLTGCGGGSLKATGAPSTSSDVAPNFGNEAPKGDVLAPADSSAPMGMPGTAGSQAGSSTGY